MRAAIPKAVTLLTSSQLAEFERTPTVTVYSNLVSTAPVLREKLLEITRSRVFPEKDSTYVDLTFAFPIFESARAEDDLLRLLDADKARTFMSEDADIIRRSLTVLMKTSDAGIRARAFEHLKRGIMDAEKRVHAGINHAFPNLPSAWTWLETQVKASKLSAMETTVNEEQPAKRTKYESYGYGSHGIQPHIPDSKRDPILKMFCDKAGWTPMKEYDEEDEEDEDECMNGYDTDEREDREYNREHHEEMEDVSDELIRTIQKWVDVLNQWPVVSERDALKKTMRQAHGAAASLFFGVDGVADALARRYVTLNGFVLRYVL